MPVWLAVVCLAIPGGAAAQQPFPWQIAAGYTSMFDVTDHVTFPSGWFVGAATDLTPWLSAVIELDGQYKTITFAANDIRLSSYGAAGGVRASGQLGRFVEFGQVLAGLVQSRGTLFGNTQTTRHLGVQPGVGLDYPIAARWAIRGELDLRIAASGHEVRAATGLVRSFR
jgi:hypothetical protein